MSATPLKDIWDASVSQPFNPTVGKASQFNVGFTLLLFAFICTSLFGLSKNTRADFV
jgi:cell cycle checkpoint protein